MAPPQAPATLQRATLPRVPYLLGVDADLPTLRAPPPLRTLAAAAQRRSRSGSSDEDVLQLPPPPRVPGGIPSWDRRSEAVRHTVFSDCAAPASTTAPAMPYDVYNQPHQPAGPAADGQPAAGGGSATMLPASFYQPAVGAAAAAQRDQLGTYYQPSVTGGGAAANAQGCYQPGVTGAAAANAQGTQGCYQPGVTGAAGNAQGAQGCYQPGATGAAAAANAQGCYQPGVTGGVANAQGAQACYQPGVTGAAAANTQGAQGCYQPGVTGGGAAANAQGAQASQRTFEGVWGVVGVLDDAVVRHGSSSLGGYERALSRAGAPAMLVTPPPQPPADQYDKTLYQTDPSQVEGHVPGPNESARCDSA